MHDCQPTDKTLQLFLQLFSAYKVPVYDYVCTIINDAQAAEDLTQDLFIKLWKKKDQLSEIGQIDQYIFRMAHNAAMSWFVKQAQDTRLNREIRNRMKVVADNVSDSIDYKDATSLLHQAVEALSPRRKYVFELSRNEGLKIQEIADKMGLSFDTVKHHLTAALAQIRRQFIIHKKRSS